MPESNSRIIRGRGASVTPRIRLICLAYAGGSPHVFRSWGDALPADVELLALRLPGHDARVRERPYQEWEPLVDDVFAAVSPYLSAPHAFYGHSFGGRLAYELAHRVETVHAGLTARLFLSGCRSPNRSQARPLMHTLSDTQFRDALRDMGGTPPEVLDDLSVMDLMLPVIREEIRLAELWGDAHGAGVSVPLTAMYGRDDPGDTREAMRDWRKFGGAGTELIEMPGGHFFPHTHRDELLAVINARIGGDDGSTSDQ
jgi:medium-chain acyl-[acyl-carrier-protein] hydrolase